LRCTPFFCQVEAVETIVWLTEVARGRRQYANIWTQLEAANAEANPELFRLAMKMATGSGKTTVMAMLMAWHTVNAVRSPNSSLFSRHLWLIAAQSISLAEPRLDGEQVYWLEGRPQELGRYVVVRANSLGRNGTDITPKPYNARTRVHEYGGAPVIDCRAWSITLVSEVAEPTVLCCGTHEKVHQIFARGTTLLACTFEITRRR
jgi:hypothetical protein